LRQNRTLRPATPMTPSFAGGNGDASPL
jgi:hypothetical protein